MARDEDAYIEQHKRRLSWMPWLYFTLKDKERAWALPWQLALQRELQRLETITIADGCFISPDAQLFAEPSRPILLRGPGTSIGADAFVHGPVTLGARVSINARVSIDGGSAGVTIGDDTRIATGVAIYAFDHGVSAAEPIRTQAVTSNGIHIGNDVWIGANAGITDGVRIGNGAVVGMGAVVTQDVEPGVIVGGVPARPIGRRR
jgi:acetyltransferase-like isoleucine patch superfamily enzyme